MTKVCARWVPRMLSIEDKKKRVESSNEVLLLIEPDPDQFFSRVITVDETWIHHYEPTTKQQSSEWKRANEPTPIKFRTQPSAGKILASVFWDAEGVILLDFLPKGQTITGVYYAYLVRRLRKILPETRRGLMLVNPFFSKTMHLHTSPMLQWLLSRMQISICFPTHPTVQIWPPPTIFCLKI